jgi:UDP:flavonoid glycosyltransferase YjiC (YdhE family)
VFVVDEAFAGILETKGFEERYAPLGEWPAPASEALRGSTLEQLDTVVRPTWSALVERTRRVDDELRELLAELRPDVIVHDRVVAMPAVLTASCPWVRIVSRNPLELPDPELPPAFSGYPSDDRSGWDEFRAEYRRANGDVHAELDELVRERGCPPLLELEFAHRSPYLNMFVYPAEADYERGRPLGPMWERLDSCVRAEGGEFVLPEGEGPLVYVSVAASGHAERVRDVLAAGGRRVLVSEGPRRLPQPALLPEVDAVVTHGGNSTVTECLHFGKPMVALPLCWDQHDNAQRLGELGLGARLDPFAFEDAELEAALEGLLGDERLSVRLDSLSERLRAASGPTRATAAIESMID